MHLTLIISSLGSGGSERVLSDLSNHWSSQNHKISLITLSPPNSQPFYPLDPTINLIQLNQSSLEFSFIKRFKNILKRVSCLRKTIKNLNPDIIISFVDVMNITTLLASFWLKIPVIVSERIDPNFHEIAKFYKWLRLKFYPFASKLIVQTNSAAEYFPQDFKKFITIIPNQVVKSEFQKNIYSEKITNIIAVGRLVQQKDHETLINAFYKLSINYPDLTLTIYGEGAERKNLENLITSLNLQNNIYLPGAIKNIQEALIKADLFIFPSHYEGFPNALCEAMAVGLPVIASNCSGNVDIIRDGIDGRLFPIGDINALTKIALELLSDPKQCKELAENAKQVCERFHPDRIFALWDQVVVLEI